MEQHFLGVQEARDSVEGAPEPQPPCIRSCDDSERWPLPLYHILDPTPEESSCHGDDFHGELLSSPCWRLRLLYRRNGPLPGAQSTLEPSPAPPTRGFWPETQKQPEAIVGDLDPAEEPDGLTFQQLPWDRLQDAGDRQQDSETSDSGHPSDRRRPPVPACWSHHRLFSGCLHWIGRAVHTVSCGCCQTVFGSKEP
ncbi:annexin-2 receptor-like [Diceros bicornis minor]|uniref:annexin-2 receptor-like n=1 Tax=Diceros bicornis minor TaxID=77932 RepID=UPI0026F1EA06|nr:annexin-2 receptor-like [Diceros bicornis minor]